MKFIDIFNKEKIKKVFKENIIFLISVVILFFIDRYSKLKVINEYSEIPIFINDYLNIDLIWNTGIGFGLLSSTSSLYYSIISIVIAIIIVFILYLIFVGRLYDKIVFAIIVSGALGNFYDRIVYKAVPDFVDFHYNNFHWFTFNFADILISLGIILMLLKNFFVKNV